MLVDLRPAKHWWAFLSAASVLMLLTVFLAVYFVPIPTASVRTLNELAPSIEGSEITVAGFVAAIEYQQHDALDTPLLYNISLADFSDYSRYREAAQTGSVDSQWWTVEPFAVSVLAGGLSGHGPYLSISNGTNISVTGEIARLSGTSKMKLVSDSGDDVVELSSPGEAGILSAPVAQKIFYFHMPSAWVSYVGFFFTLLFGVLYLRTRDRACDRVASSAAELGVLFATIAIATGPIWAKEEWGVYWRWDDTKLVTTFVMWLVYIGYLMLRAAILDHNVRARISAVYGILGFVTMPMSLLSSRIAPLIQSSHPQVIASSGGDLSPEAGITVGVAVVAFTFLFITMLIKRVEIEESEEELEELKRAIGGEE